MAARPPAELAEVSRKPLCPGRIRRPGSTPLVENRGLRVVGTRQRCAPIGHQLIDRLETADVEAGSGPARPSMMIGESQQSAWRIYDVLTLPPEGAAPLPHATAYSSPQASG